MASSSLPPPFAHSTEATSLLPHHHPHHTTTPHHAATEQHTSSSSSSSIGYLGSFAIAVNSLAGPAILQLPFQFQESGLLPTSACLLVVGLLAALCSLHMANTVSCLPNNANYSKCVEFSDVFGAFLGPRCYQATQLLFFLTTMCLNTAAMVDTAQVVDSVLSWHGTYGLEIQGPRDIHMVSWVHPSDSCHTRRDVKEGHCDPFSDLSSDNNSLLLTAGYILTAAVFLPICLMDLKENTNWQIGGFGLTLTLCLFFAYHFWTMTMMEEATAIQVGYEHSSLQDSSSSNNQTLLLQQHHHQQYHHSSSSWTRNVSLYGHVYRNLLGVVLFNFTLVLAIPAWLHEKKPSVSVHKIVVGATTLSTFLYILVGALAAIAIPRANVNLLAPMVSGAFGTNMAVAGSLFSFFIIGLDIPLFSVLTRYNLTHSGMCSEQTANILVVWLPWSLAWILYQGTAIANLLDWGGVLLTSAVAFVLPLYLALHVVVVSSSSNNKTTGSSMVMMGSLPVYGARLWTSRKDQIVVLQLLYYLTVGAVVVAIGGKVESTAHLEEYMHSEVYLNGSSPSSWQTTGTDSAIWDGLEMVVAWGGML